MTCQQRLWNSVGASHTNEILHAAWLHPDMSARAVWRNPPAKACLIAATTAYFTFLLSDEYHHFVPAQPNTLYALTLSPAVTHYIIGLFTHVYQKTQGTVRVLLAQYNFLVENG